MVIGQHLKVRRFKNFVDRFMSFLKSQSNLRGSGSRVWTTGYVIQRRGSHGQLILTVTSSPLTAFINRVSHRRRRQKFYDVGDFGKAIPASETQTRLPCEPPR